MKYLYAPWRGTYAQKAQDQIHLTQGCPFCLSKAQDDTQNYVIKRYNSTIVLLNAYPYNPGHLLIVPARHVASLHDLTPEERNELMNVISDAPQRLQKTLGNSGTNIGLNLGDEASGGSIPEHLHVHIIPRWKGDTNFLPLIAETKQLSEDLNVVYQKLLEVF